MAKNSSLNAANKAKQDEFYTQYADIQNEINHYEKHFDNKTVLCNCDDPFESNFCKFFLRNFNYLGLKRLICTSYSTSPFIGEQFTICDEFDEPLSSGKGYVMDISEVPMANGRGVTDDDINALLTSKKRGVKRLKGNGDFRSEECIDYLKQADIVVTNPPFSLFREYVALLMKYEKKFLIIGNQNNVTYKEIFPLIQQNKLWLGWKYGDMSFRVPDYYEPRSTRFWIDDEGHRWRSFGTICWYTNLDHDKRHEPLILYCHYYGNESDYPKYDNYDAINVNKVSEIPCDYFENMAVPITYIDKHNPEQFEIIDANEIRTNDEVPIKQHGLIKDKDAVITIKKEEKNSEKDLTQTNKSATIVDEPTDYLCTSCHQTKAVTELWECQSHSLTNTTLSNLRLSDLTGMYQTIQDTDTGLQSMDEKPTQEYLSRESCNGVIGVPITFLGKYNPDEFEIVGATESEGKGFSNGLWNEESHIAQPLVNGQKIYKRIFIKRRKKNEH